jgi:hypothetical protein
MSSPESRHTLSIVGILVFAGILIVFLTLLSSAGDGTRRLDVARRTHAKNDAIQIATALNAYLFQYGKLPPANAVNANSAKLMNTLAGTLKSDSSNPKALIFLEVPAARNHRNGAEMEGNSGLFSSGYKDPWGNEYEIRIDTDIAAHPKKPAINGPQGVVSKAVIVWTPGDPAREHDSADPTHWIKSWE